MLTGKEIPMVLNLPKRSMNGLTVVEMAEFSRSVVYQNLNRNVNLNERTINLGNIYYMGSEEAENVLLDVDMLPSHTAIFGASGSGKSYTTNKLLYELLEKNIKMLVIEPAKYVEEI